jgi:hypothetical protein
MIIDVSTISPRDRIKEKSTRKLNVSPVRKRIINEIKKINGMLIDATKASLNPNAINSKKKIIEITCIPLLPKV